MTMKVLFYGTLQRSAPKHTRVVQFCNKLVSELLDSRIVVATREGEPSKSLKDWIPLDNIVLDIACKHRDRESLPYESVISYGLATEIDSGRCSEHDRRIILLPAPSRLEMYKEMLLHTDALITMGGREGVYRIGLVATVLGLPVFPLPFSGGTSRTLWSELASSGCLAMLGDDIRYLLSLAHPPTGTDSLRKLVEAIRSSVKVCQDKPSIKAEYSDASFVELIKSMSFVQVIAVLSLLITLISLTAGATWKIRDALSPPNTQISQPNSTLSATKNQEIRGKTEKTNTETLSEEVRRKHIPQVDPNGETTSD